MLLLIANEAPLGPERRDHALKGAWARYRECHVGGDFLLIYRVDDTDGPSGFRLFCPRGHPRRSVRMTTAKSIPSVSVTYARTGRTVWSNEFGMRPM